MNNTDRTFLTFFPSLELDKISISEFSAYIKKGDFVFCSITSSPRFANDLCDLSQGFHSFFKSLIPQVKGKVEEFTKEEISKLMQDEFLINPDSYIGKLFTDIQTAKGGFFDILKLLMVLDYYVKKPITILKLRDINLNKELVNALIEDKLDINSLNLTKSSHFWVFHSSNILTSEDIYKYQKNLLTMITKGDTDRVFAFGVDPSENNDIGK